MRWQSEEVGGLGAEEAGHLNTLPTLPFPSFRPLGCRHPFVGGGGDKMMPTGETRGPSVQELLVRLLTSVDVSPQVGRIPVPWLLTPAHRQALASEYRVWTSYYGTA